MIVSNQAQLVKMNSTIGKYLATSTCQLIFNESYTCSGALLNNTRDQGRPLILTAAHCIENEADLNSVVVVFGKRKLLMDKAYAGLEWRSIGATLLSSSKELDFALLELNSTIPDYVSPIYLGWNKTISQPEFVSSIHSPDFEDTQYSFSLVKPSLATFGGLYKTVDLGFWRVDQWAQGTTSQGSSGAPLLDSNFDLIGGLSGSTDWPNYRSDFFFRFDLAYDHFSNTVNQLKPWLDPANTGSTGHYQPTKKIRNYNYSSRLTGTVKLLDGANITEKFSVRDNSKINGVYISVGDMSENSGLKITLVLSQNGSEFYVEETDTLEFSHYEAVWLFHCAKFKLAISWSPTPWILDYLQVFDPDLPLHLLEQQSSLPVQSSPTALQLPFLHSSSQSSTQKQLSISISHISSPQYSAK